MRIETDRALSMTQLMYDNCCGGTLNLYLFDSAGRYSAPQRFPRLADPAGEISVAEARALAEAHAKAGGEARITNQTDLVVHHVRSGSLIFPPNQDRVEFFWERVGWSEQFEDD